MSDALPKVSVSIVTYDRLVTLKPTLVAFLANTDYPRDRLELIVCDDASPVAVQGEIRRMPFDVRCLATRRRGLGANANQGLEAATGDLILQLQDDWECRGPPDYLRRAVAALGAAPEVGMIILNQHPCRLPIRDQHAAGRDALRIYDNRPEVEIRLVGEHAYTDWPHLKRRSFHDTLGGYREGVRMWEAELEFSRRVNDQTAVFIADMPGLDAFRHIGEEHSFNRTWRTPVEALIGRLPAGGALISTYRVAKSAIARRGSRARTGG